MLTINNLHLQARAGSESAEDQLFSCLRERFCLFAHHRIGNKQESEEVVQEALTVIAQEYKATEIRTSFSAWAYQVLENRILNFLRARQTQRRRQVPLDQAEPVHRDQPENPGLKRRLLDCLGKICRANNRYARILALQYQGYSAAEIAERLKVTRNNLYVILSRARHMLETCLETGELD